jgi:hypothetical protein
MRDVRSLIFVSLPKVLVDRCNIVIQIHVPSQRFGAFQQTYFHKHSKSLKVQHVDVHFGEFIYLG